MQKQVLFGWVGVVFLIQGGAAYSLDHHHHPHPPAPPSPQYDVPAPPPPPSPPGVPVDPLCGCNVLGRCADTLRSFTDLVIRNRASEVVCGPDAELCCYENDIWPGYKDPFSHLAPCVPENLCIRHYGVSPTDVRDFGSIGPCVGLGAVRCLDGFEPSPPPVPIIPAPPQGPTHFVFPILENPSVPEPHHPVVNIPPVAYGPPVVNIPPVAYSPPVPITEPPTTTTTEEPTTTPTPPPPSTGYDLPDPPIAYEPPQPEPEISVAYGPPQPFPEPVPVPPTSYGPPQPVVVPPTSYGPPSPAEYYAPPNPTPPETGPPSPPVLSTYGVPGLEQGTPLGYAYTSRFGYPYGYSRYGGYYPGLRFRLRKYFGVGFLG